MLQIGGRPDCGACGCCYFMTVCGDRKSDRLTLSCPIWGGKTDSQGESVVFYESGASAARPKTEMPRNPVVEQHVALLRPAANIMNNQRRALKAKTLRHNANMRKSAAP